MHDPRCSRVFSRTDAKMTISLFQAIFIILKIVVIKPEVFDIKVLQLTMDEAVEISKVIANEHRMNILKILSTGPHNVNELAEKLGLPFSTTAVNVKKLEDVNLIITELVPGRGTQKINSKNYDRIVIDLFTEDKEKDKNVITIDMPIGEYVDCQAEPSCGLVGDTDYIGIQDDPRSFYEPGRREAQLLYFRLGFVEYRYPNRIPYGTRATEIEFSAEICSEAPYHKLDWPSDITLWVNNVDIGTWTSPGDFGGQRGLLLRNGGTLTLPNTVFSSTGRSTTTGAFSMEPKFPTCRSTI